MSCAQGGGPRVVPVSAVWKKQKMFLPHPRGKVSIVGSLRDREVECSASDHQGSNFKSCVWRTVSSQSSHHPQEVLLAQFSLYVHRGGVKPDSFHFCHAHKKLCRFCDVSSPGHALCNAVPTLKQHWINVSCLMWWPANTKHLITFIQRRPNVFDIGPTLYKCIQMFCVCGI